MTFKEAIDFINNTSDFKLLDQGQGGKFPYQQCAYIDTESFSHNMSLRFFFCNETGKMFTKERL